MKTYKGKAIYQPSGKAGEYSKYACNFYVGCSNGCAYCYCKNGILAGAMGQDKPQLKKCFKDEAHALEVFEKELKANLPELQKHGLFFSFTTDPFLPETMRLFGKSAGKYLRNDIPVQMLTKCADWVDYVMRQPFSEREKGIIAFGFTLTGHNELEPNASTNAERIEAMRKLHEAGFKTWASIEPVISVADSINMVQLTRDFCDLYKVGLMSGKKYDSDDLVYLIQYIIHHVNRGIGAKIYFKDNLLKQAGICRKDLPANCVGMDYNMFNE